MKKLAVVFAIIISTYVFAQSMRLSFSTGDAEIETHLNEVNNYASADISLFRKDLSFRFSASNKDMDLYLVRERMRPADVYYGYVISFTTGRPFPEVMKMYKQKKGWGSIAKELGIKPGSSQFHALKNHTLKSITKEGMKKSKLKAAGKKSSGDKKNVKGKKSK